MEVTRNISGFDSLLSYYNWLHSSGVEQGAENACVGGAIPSEAAQKKVFGRTDMQQTLNLCGKPQREFNSHSTYSKGTYSKQ